MSLIEDMTADRFEAEVIGSPIPVLIDFHAVWCGPCKAMMPTLTDMAREFEGEIRVVKVDIDAESTLAQNYGVRAVPTFILFDGGEQKERFSGQLTRSKIASVFERYVSEGGE